MEKLQQQLGIGLEGPKLEGDQKDKYNALDNMYVGTVPPGKNPVENMVTKSRVMDELMNSKQFCWSQLEVAKNMEFSLDLIERSSTKEVKQEVERGKNTSLHNENLKINGFDDLEDWKESLKEYIEARKLRKEE